MEKNEAIRTLPRRGDNTELEKFKRRLIRAVARMLIHEKRNEAEVWEGLQKQTGSDCKELWSRMHALTRKKLDRLLAAQDRVDLLPKPARMSVTDWLMFDTVIAHEDFDVIGMSETSKEDKQVIIDLFELVEKCKIEFLAGDQLADAWSEVTIQYNKDDRQCTPMLLQRRWYQFKLATRARFYKFWSIYKGTTKRLHLAEDYKPTPLQTKLAMRYKPLVVKPFMMWEDLVKHKLVILPEEFELKSNNQTARNEEIAPEVMCIEPNLETIDLDDDSDLEYRDTPQKDKQPVVTVKQEPKDTDDIDDDSPYENRQEKITHFAEAVMEATAMELDEIELADSLDSNLNDGDAKQLEKTNDDDVTEIPPKETPEIALTEEDKGNLVTENQAVDLPEDSKLDESNALIINGNRENNIEIIKEDEAVTAIDENEIQKDQVDQVLPQITSVFGGVDVSNESLSKIGLLTAQITNNVGNAIIKKERPIVNADSIDLSSDSLDGIPVDKDGEIHVLNEDQIAPKDSFDGDTNMEVDIKPDISKNNWFGELSNDIEFADDGIQLIDDGIAYVEDDCAQQIGDVKLVIKEEQEDVGIENIEDNSTPTIDEKLLMMPVVRTVKLEDMGILPLHLLQHVDNKGIIEVIHIKSKPIVKIKEEKIDIKVESSDEETVEEIKKVKLSSVLLQKPRSRTYNPIQLCKNPDFNTRLKKLTVGFFSSARNRLLLKSCQPLSIDVSKAFECRLVNGTMHLEASDDKNVNQNIDIKESTQSVSVVPSAMAVQSLIDNTKGEILPPTIPTPVETSPVIKQTTQILSPSDICEINRNQRLLTAEIAPLKSRHDYTHVPVTIVPKNRYGKVIAGPASRTKLTYTPVVDITKEDKVKNTTQNTATNQNTHIKNKEKVHPPWKPRQKPEIPWFCKSYTYSSDTLLALDSLNKMLCIFTESEKELASKKKDNTGPNNEQNNTVISLDDISTSSNKDDDVEVVGETKLDAPPAKKKKKRGRPPDPNTQKRPRPVFCCWARERICQLLFAKKLISKHNCPFPLCVCCCRNALVDYILKKKEAGKSLDNEKNTAEPLGCIGLGELAGVAAKSLAHNDVAEIVPVVQKTANKEVANVDTVIGNTETNEIDEPIILDQDVDNSIDLGAETEVTTAEPIKAVSRKPAKPRIRVMHQLNVGPMKLLEANQSRPPSPPPPSPPPPPLPALPLPPLPLPPLPPALKKISTERKKALSMNPSKTKEQLIIRKNLMPVTTKSKKLIPISHPPIAAKTYSSSKNNLNQKMIYLNSKQISELPSDNPIFLGQNKILLTTAKFPANFKAFEAFQANLRQTMALPKGIHLVLLPSGRLTYIRDRKFHINEEFLTALPQLIEAIQQQIDASVGVHPNTLPDVISLSDDEVVENTEKTESEVPKEIDQAKNPQAGEAPKTGDTEPTVVIDTSTSQNLIKISSEPEILASETSKDDNNETSTTAMSCTENAKIQSDEKIASVIETTTVNNKAKTNDTSTPLTCSDNGNKQSDQTTPISESDTDTKANSEKENAGTKSKNILSDLMAMSGIEATDITSTTQEQATGLTTAEQGPETLDVQQLNNQENVPENVVVSIPRKTLTNSLTAITSLSELKYACAQCSSFFKLDIETGILHPINVCMKKFNENITTPEPQLLRHRPILPKTTTSSEPIDLTEDEVSDSVSTQTEDFDSLSIANPNDGSEASSFTFETVKPNNESVFGLNNRRTESEDININGINVTSCGKVKPLKLFKSNSQRPAILGRKLKEIQMRIKEAMNTQDLIRRKLKRKQELQELATGDEVEIMSIDSNKDDSSDDSSDEEPLAKKASKMRAIEELHAGSKEIGNVREKSVETALEIEVPPLDVVPTDTEEPVADEPLADDALSEYEQDMPVESLDETLLEETLLEENDADEDCILGV